MSEDSAITAVAWRPDGEGASYAIDLSPASAEQSQMRTLSLMERNRDGSSATFLLAPPTLEPAGIVISLRYSPSGEYLLAAKTNTKRGLVQVWKTARPEGSEIQTVHEPIAWRLFDSPVSEVVWSGHDTIVICGEAGSSLLYQVDGSQQQASEAQVAGSIAIRGLNVLNSSILPADYAWDYVRLDKRNKIAAFASIDARKLVVTPRVHSPDLAVEKDVALNLAGNPIALEFQPGQFDGHGDDVNANSQPASLLAVAFDDGTCCIYSITEQTDDTVSATAGPLLSLAEGPVSTIAWSVRGDYLAVGNADLVQIWHTASLKRADTASNIGPDAHATWRPAQEVLKIDDEQHDEDSVAYQPSLSWSSDDTLAYAADKQVSLVRAFF